MVGAALYEPPGETHMTRASDFFFSDGTPKAMGELWRACPAVAAIEKAIQARFKQYQSEVGLKPKGRHKRLRNDLSHLAALAFGTNVDQKCMAEYLGFMLAALAMHDYAAPILGDQYNRIVPLANKGVKFSTGGKARAGSVRKAVRKVLKSKPAASPDEVWHFLMSKPPNGMSFYDSVQFGRRIETDGKAETQYPRFRNIVSEEKKALLASK